MVGTIIPTWQVSSLLGVLVWVVVSSFLGLTRICRSLLQPWVSRRVAVDVPLILRVQNLQHEFLDNFFFVLSFVVSVPFYTGFLPLLFWSGHGKLARQTTLLIAFCDYLGNAIKDLISVPRPSCPPVRRITATDVEKENAMEFGFPSSHALNTVCLAGYLLHYIVKDNVDESDSTFLLGYFLASLLVGLVGIGMFLDFLRSMALWLYGIARIYLGMHSIIDVVAGILIGIGVLTFWCSVDEYVDDFVVSGQNVTSFCAALSLLLCFAYPTPELPTPSFEFHTAFIGVAFGIVSGVQQTFHQFHHEDVAQIFTDRLSLGVFIGRLLIGIPTILLMKLCTKALSKWLLPVICNTLSIPIRSSCYIPALVATDSSKNREESKHPSYLQKVVGLIPQDSFDVDTGIRFLQYAGLAWSVVDLVPSIFSRLSL